MDAYDFFQTFVSAAARDAAIAAWADAHFGRPVKVFADLESGALPQSSEMPYMIFHSPGVEKHQDVRVQRYSLAVDLAIDKNALQDRAETNVSEPAGVELILDLGTLLAAAVKTALPSNTTFGYMLAADTLGALPEVHGVMDLDFSTIVTIAGDPLA